ncbi:DUF6272 family protein [Halothiobacillus sp. DCM-1]|uniref:DUF6272 family protein n=1 Tax=Halothiobacillus sp. DCM-1 TaxID=3112558 RepID=UPI003249E088
MSDGMTTYTHGEFLDFPPGGERLSLSFSPGQLPLQQRWRNNGLSADFMGDYVTAFFPRDDHDPATGRRQSEIQGAVSYIANELLENAMKYHDAASGASISIELVMTPDRVTLTLNNRITAAQAEAFQAFIHKLAVSDADTLYMEQLESNAMTGSSSGLGLLTMVNDYGAALAWQLVPQASGGVEAYTQVALTV